MSTNSKPKKMVDGSDSSDIVASGIKIPIFAKAHGGVNKVFDYSCVKYL